MSIFTERLKLIRNAQGISQKKVSESLEMPVRSFQRYETGENEPTIFVALKLADYFGVSLDYLTGRTDNPNINK